MSYCGIGLNWPLFPGRGQARRAAKSTPRRAGVKGRSACPDVGGNVHFIDSFFDIFIDAVAAGTFSTDIRGFNYGTPDFRIRESPTRSSMGWTTVTPLGGGHFRIDSFFDVFTEFSLDGGQTWIPDSNPNGFLVFLVPEPGVAFPLAVAGLASVLRRRRPADRV